MKPIEITGELLFIIGLAACFIGALVGIWASGPHGMQIMGTGLVLVLAAAIIAAIWGEKP